ncbi:replication factor A domain-containing protein [Rhizoctonia solani AG-1 IA]|uniref:Replication factor A domain-containing protein n=1 Tax=Thanatephorus cucumeris (strain AG1-IA) TaxID=983506 RepID=L8X2D4_THACA|nr:replication factor A domain-containing protein [Rhizoctonia solani AG-1 IA]
MESGNPRINSARMSQYVGRHVRLTCKIIKAQGENIIVQASDGGQVEVKLTTSRPGNDNYVEILGKVVDAQRMVASEVFPQGDNIDLEVVDQLVELMHKYPEIYM